MKKKVKLKWSEMNTKQRVFAVLDKVFLGFWLVIVGVLLITFALSAFGLNKSEEGTSDIVAYADESVSSYMNLGYYDTYCLDSTDGAVTITRATGYLTKDDFSQDVNNCGVINWFSAKGLHSFNSNDIVADDSLYVCNKNYIRVSAFSQWESTTIDNLICANSLGRFIILTETLPDDLLVQYKLSSSTTEKVSLNSLIYQDAYNAGYSEGSTAGLSGIFADTTFSGSYCLESNSSTYYSFSSLTPKFVNSGISFNTVLDYIHSTMSDSDDEAEQVDLTINFTTPVYPTSDTLFYTDDSDLVDIDFYLANGKCVGGSFSYNTRVPGFWAYDLSADNCALGISTIKLHFGRAGDTLSGSLYYYNSDMRNSYANGYNQGYSSGYDSGYLEGKDEGYTSGYSQGTTDGYSSGYTQGSSDGYSQGTTDGYSSGYSQGTTDGYSDGTVDGYKTGYTQGSSDGYTSGYGVGHTAGYQDGFDATGVGGFSWLISSVESFLNTSFFGDFGIGTLLYVCLGASLILMVIKMFA
jgi:hypothetical protein